MAKHATSEKRKYPRIHSKVGLNIIACNGKKTTPKLDEEIGLNISVGGVLIECSKRLAKKTRLKLKIMLTSDSKFMIMQIPARIAWNKKTFRNTYYLGCKFTRLKPRDEKIIIKYIKDRLP